jgi:DNA-binding XRE family transcriptional regulator
MPTPDGDDRYHAQVCDAGGRNVDLQKIDGQWFWQEARLVPRHDLHGPFPTKTAAITDARTTRPSEDEKRLTRIIGANVRAARILAGLTQQQAADHIGVSTQQMSKYENGINRISAAKLYILAEALSEELTSFFEGLET